MFRKRPGERVSQKKPGRAYTDNSKEDPQLRHDTNTLHLSEANAIAETAVQVKEGTATWFKVAFPKVTARWNVLDTYGTYTLTGQ